MAVLPIIKFPDKILRQRARKIRTIDRSINRLASDMIDTMNDADGVGLAANQVGVLKRVIVVQLPEEEGAEPREEPREEPRVYINPEIVYREGVRVVEEGCLSVPGFVGTVERSIWVKFRALNLESKTVRIKADSLLAQILEHEVDHLNGILYMDHLLEHEKLRPIEVESDSSDGDVQKTQHASGLHSHSGAEIIPSELNEKSIRPII